KLPTINTGTAKTLYVWYRKSGEAQPAVSAPYGRNAVWLDYKGVWHLRDTNWTDSSGNGNDLTLTGTGSITADGVLLGASSDLRTSNAAGLTGLSTLQLSTWIKPNNTTGGLFGAVNGENGSGYNYIFLDVAGTEWTTNAPNLTSKIRVGAAVVGRSGDAAGAGFAQGDILFCGYSYDGISEKIILNSTVSPYSNTGALWSNTEFGIIIGRVHSTAPTHQAPLKEARLSSVVFSDAYNVTTYNNQLSPAAFASSGTPESAGGAVAILTINSSANSHSSNSVTFMQAHVLTMDDALHSQTADNIILLQSQTLNMANSSHNVGGVGPILSQGSSMVILEAGQGVTSDDVTISQLQILAIQNATHGLSGKEAGLFIPTAFTSNPRRTNDAVGADRRLSSGSEDRATQPTNNRTLRI
ncbi:MAG: hypothetical protein L3J50_13120, partial [Emcibacter sp.]|nr:hypothetical protein [Emcibacter sp.]